MAAVGGGRANVQVDRWQTGPPDLWGDQVSKLPGRLWKLPWREDDEAAEESIGRFLALSDSVFAIGLTLPIRARRGIGRMWFGGQPDDLSTAGSCATALARRHRTDSLGRVEVTDREDMPLGPHDPRAEARRAEAVLDPSAVGVVHGAAGQQDAVSRTSHAINPWRRRWSFRQDSCVNGHRNSAGRRMRSSCWQRPAGPAGLKCGSHSPGFAGVRQDPSVTVGPVHGRW